MMRRCAVMRMPLAMHCASMKFGLVSVTAKISGGRGPVLHKVPPQDQRGRRLAAALRVIARTAADFRKTRAGVKLSGRTIVLVHLEEHGARAQAGEAAQMQVEEAAREPAAPPRARDRDGENFRLVGGAARDDEADRLFAPPAAAAPPPW